MAKFTFSNIQLHISTSFPTGKQFGRVLGTTETADIRSTKLSLNFIYAFRALVQGIHWVEIIGCSFSSKMVLMVRIEVNAFAELI